MTIRTLGGLVYSILINNIENERQISIVVNPYELLGVRLSIFSVINKYVIRQNILGFV